MKAGIVLGAAALAVAAAACASTGSTASGGAAPVASLGTGAYGAAECSPATVDSVFASVAPVYRNCDVNRPAMARDTSVFLNDLPPQGQSCLSAVVEFVVGANGLTLPQPTKIVQTNSPAFARALLRSVERWRYVPAERNGKPVRQLIRLEAATRATSALDPPFNPNSFANVGPTTC